LLLDCLLELLKLVGNLAQSQPQYFGVARRWKASRMGYFDFKRIAGTRGAFDDLTNSHDSGWGNRSQKLHGEVDVRRFDPAHLRIDLLQVRLQVRDSPPDGFGYLDTDERAYRIGLSVACLFLSSRHLAGRSALPAHLPCLTHLCRGVEIDEMNLAIGAFAALGVGHTVVTAALVESSRLDAILQANCEDIFL